MVSIDDLTFATNLCSRVYVPFDKTLLYREKYAWKQHQIQKCKGKREPFECDVMNIGLHGPSIDEIKFKQPID